MSKRIFYIFLSGLVVVIASLGLLLTTQNAEAQFGIPAGATVTKATFSLYVTQNRTATVNIHNITAAWTETDVTWDNFGTSFDPAVVSSFNPTSLGWVSADITPLVQAWLSGTLPNYGFLLEQGGTLDSTYVSSEGVDVTRRPKLEICYTVSGGAETCTTIQRPGTPPTDVVDTFIWQDLLDMNFGTGLELKTGLADGYKMHSLLQFQFTVEHPAISIVKYTNGQEANNPNGSDVPQIKPGDPVVWTYKVTNTGDAAIPTGNIAVTDDQTGVTPTFDMELTGNGDSVFDPAEVWQYKATGVAVDLSSPPAGVKTVPNACTLNQTQPPRTAYVNQGTVTIPGASATVQSSYCNPLNPGISIVKYTNGQEAKDPNGSDVPQIRPGDPVVWTYKVTNTGLVSILQADVVVSDNQPGVTPIYDMELTGNGDSVFDPAEVWQYKATGAAVDATLPPLGTTIIHDACSYNNTMPQSPGYVNTGTVTIPGASASANSSYCNPLHYPYFGENGYLGIEDWINGDFDYNDFGFYFRIEETITWSCPGGVCGPYLTHVTVTTTAKVYDSGMDHLIHLHRVFNGSVQYSVTRTAAPFPNQLTLFDGKKGSETPAGTYLSSTGDIDVTLYNTLRYGHPQKLINETVVVDFTINSPLLNPHKFGTFVRSFTVGSTTFNDLDPIMSQYDFWEEGTLYQSRWHLKDTHLVTNNSQQKNTPAARIIPIGTVLPFMIVVPYTNWIPPYEGTTITGPYGSFRDFYMTGAPQDWYLPSRITNNNVQPGGISWGPYSAVIYHSSIFFPTIRR